MSVEASQLRTAHAKEIGGAMWQLKKARKRLRQKPLSFL